MNTAKKYPSASQVPFTWTAAVPSNTTKTRVRPTIHATQGWSTLGDVGYVDEDGYLYLTDRKHFMIISGGVNIYPQEAENALIAHDAVVDVAVFGVPNPDFGEEVKGVVQLRDTSMATPEMEVELLDYCRSVIQHQVPARYRLPRRVAPASHGQALQAIAERRMLGKPVGVSQRIIG